jgi:hypothetical protein
MKALVAVCLVGILAGCSTAPPQANWVKPGKLIANAWSAPSVGSGVLTITRDAGLTGSLCTIHAYLDGAAIGDLRISQTITIYPTPGEHVASVKSAALCDADDERSLTIKPGETKRFRIAYAGSGTLKIEPTAF